MSTRTLDVATVPSSRRAGLSRARILVVEDDPKTAETVRLYLAHAGFAVTVAYHGRCGLEAARTLRPDLMVLDLMLPGLDGWQICRTLRACSDTVAIIMLTARTSEKDRIGGLDLGADDYLSKPFSPRELVARVRAVLRRTREPSAAPQRRHTFAGLTVDEGRREVLANGRSVTLTPTEYALLVTMVRAPRRVFSREELIARAIDEDFEGSGRTIDTHITNLRRKLEVDREHPALIETVFGVGYRFAGRRDDP